MSIATWFDGFAFGVAISTLLCTLVAKRDHAEMMRMLSAHGDWLRVVIDKQMKARPSDD